MEEPKTWNRLSVNNSVSINDSIDEKVNKLAYISEFDSIKYIILIILSKT